ncbi:ribosome-associated protein [Seinonella peptonophila]|uniref:Ribosomal silencing factor RsfS n=1 Tax=Seinonella peptonophila TaxID=112248 RepID=A0A1M4W7B4_9BACL|nr:ribosome silencing factor [Seinonella peptonophila]SHE77151.1 ribosome-associated protein [Seinonella peptonophila]
MSLVEIAYLAATAAEEKKAHNVTILDIRGISTIADYFVICHGTTERQVQAIVKNIRGKIQEANIPCLGIEGIREARWVLIDLGDVVVHVFHKEERDYYDLERLWGDAESLHVQ